MAMKVYSEEMLAWIKQQYDDGKVIGEIVEGFTSLYFPITKRRLQDVIHKRHWSREIKNGCKYSQVELEWIKERYISGEYKMADLLRIVNERTKRNITLNGLSNLLVKFGWRKQKAGMWQPLTDEQEMWLVEHYEDGKCWRTLGKMFAEEFFPITPDRVAHAVRKHIDVARRNAPRLSTKEKQWLIDILNQQKYTYAEVSKIHNKEFPNRPMTPDAVSQFAGVNKIPLSKEIKHRVKVEASQNNGYELGTESKNYSGQTVVKIAKGRGQHRNWTLKKNVIWEKTNGKKIPKGWVVVCLDGDENNLNPQNLVVAPKYAEKSFRMIKVNNQHLKGDAEWGGAFLKLKELELILKDNKVDI